MSRRPSDRSFPKPPALTQGWERRSLYPEILDSLDPSHPEAARSRRDLRIINRFMGAQRWFRRCLQRIAPEERTVHEIGAGDGHLASTTAQQISLARWTGFDLVSPPGDWPASWGWHTGDCLQSGHLCEAPVLVANLVLHHFNDSLLEALGKRIENGSVRYLIFNEPARDRRYVQTLRLGRLIGFSPVTLHDGTVSIAAGFQGDELAQTLGLSKQAWDWTYQLPFGGAYRMFARRL